MSTLHPTLEALFDKYFNRTITPEEMAQLEAWLAEKPEHAEALARAGLAHGLTREVAKQKMQSNLRPRILHFAKPALLAASVLLAVGIGIWAVKENEKKASPAVADPRLVDSDGDGDPLWFYPQRSSTGEKRYVSAVRIEDLSHKLNLDTATAMGGKSAATTKDESPSPAAPVIIRSAALRLRADDAQAAARKIETLATTLGGFVSRSESQGEARHAASAHIEIRVPAAALDQARAQVRAMGTTLSDASSATEVGAQLVDLAARITNLETAEKELRQIISRMAEKTDKTGELMIAYRELTSVREQIETLKAQEKNIKDRVALSTLAVDVFEEAPPPSTPEGWDAWRPFQSAWAVLVGLAQTAWTLGAYLLVVGVPLLLLVGGSAWLIHRKWRKNK